jgi:hypothetical protein
MPDPLTVSAVLLLVAKKALETLAGKVSEELLKKLQGDPAQKAFAAALESAINSYALSVTGLTRYNSVKPLREQENNPLKDKDVAAELAQVLRFDPKPNAALIGGGGNSTWMPQMHGSISRRRRSAF